MEKSIGRELHSVCNLIMRYANNNPAASRQNSMSGTNGWIIGFLLKNDGRDVFQKDLEQAFSITRSTASKVVDLMEKKGLVQRCRVSRDGRLRKLVLTEKARSLSQHVRDNSQSVEKKLTAGFSADELDTLYSYLERLKGNLVAMEK